MEHLVTLLFAVLAGSSAITLREACPDPPWNGNLAYILVEAIEEARPLLVTGIPSLGIPPLDPLGPIPRIPFNIDIPGLRMEGAVDETQIMNFANFIICSLNITGILPPYKFAVEFHLDNLHIQGKYEVDGLIASLFPVFGSGDYTLDTYQTGFSGYAKMSINYLHGYATIKDLSFNVFFDDMELVMECILGCGSMADLINGVISDIGPPMFEAIWGAIEPPLAQVIQEGINTVLKNISISDLLPKNKQHLYFLGNGNDFVDAITDDVGDAMEEAGLDPGLLPNASINLGVASAELYDGKVTGLSALHRSGTCTIDKVASWLFLYANLAVEDLQVSYSANITSSSSEAHVEVSGTVSQVAVYMVARQDTFGLITDIDQFVIPDFGKIDVDIKGLGALGYLLEPLTEAVVNLVREDIANLLETEVKDILQNALGETPWPPQ